MKQKIAKDHQKMPYNLMKKEFVLPANTLKKRKKIINWDNREKLLRVLDNYRRKDGSYDCIVSGSGGKDSVTIAHILKYKYGMNPLTVTYSPILYTDIGFKNHRAWVDKGGFDNLLFSPNGRVTSIFSREAFKNLLHPMQPFKFGIKSIAAKTALKYGLIWLCLENPMRNMEVRIIIPLKNLVMISIGMLMIQIKFFLVVPTIKNFEKISVVKIF